MVFRYLCFCSQRTVETKMDKSISMGVDRDSGKCCLLVTSSRIDYFSTGENRTADLWSGVGIGDSAGSNDV